MHTPFAFFLMYGGYKDFIFPCVFTEYISKKHSIPGAPGGIADDFRQLLYQCGALPLLLPYSILQNQGKTKVLLVSPTFANLYAKIYILSIQLTQAPKVRSH